MGRKKKKESGEELFELFYSEEYKERWPELKAALLYPVKHMELRFSDDLSSYFLDKASWVAAQCLPVKKGMKVLDMCAAPGGKSLIMASFLKGSGSLTSNELSPTRRNRLKTVLKEHLPEEWYQNIRVSGFDASKWCLYEKNIYNAVLLDAPCSSERHLLHSPEHLKKWTPARTRNLAFRQYSLAVSALDTLKPDGWLLYSTCSLSPLENDGIIRKMLKKRKGAFQVCNIENSEGEKTEYGRIILPDKGGWGPIYFCLMKKTDFSQEGDSANL